MKRNIVDKLKEEGTSVSVSLKAVELPSSTYYYHPSSKRKSCPLDENLVAAIHKG
jgi:hypothetical protein